MGGFFDKLKSADIFGKKGNSVLGVDLGSSSIKVVQLKKQGGSAVLETYGELSLGPYDNAEIGKAVNLSADKLAEALKDVLREANVTATNAGFSIPFASSLLTFIEMPYVSTQQLNKMIPIEARKYIPVPITEVMLDWFIVPESEEGGASVDEKEGAEDEEAKKKKREVLLVAIHNDILQKYNTIVEKSGLTTDFFEIEIFSTIRSVLDQGVAPAMIIDIGSSTTKMYIVEYGIVRVSHVVNKGSQDVTFNISKAFAIPLAEAEEMKRDKGLVSQEENIKEPALLTLDYIFSEANRVLLNYQRKNNRNVQKVVLTGGGSIMKGILELGRERLETDVELGNPFSKVSTPAFLESVLSEAGSEFAVAVGLALRKLQDFDP